MLKPTAGAKQLRSFLQDNKLTQEACKSALGVSGSTVHDWLGGYKRPSAHHRKQIEIWTAGVVLADAWEHPREKKDLTTVAPFRPTGTEG